MLQSLDAASGFASRLYRGEQKGDQDGDDRDHDKELDQSETDPLETFVSSKACLILPTEWNRADV